MNRSRMPQSSPDAASCSAPNSRMVLSIRYLGRPRPSEPVGMIRDLSTSRRIVSKISVPLSSPLAHTSAAAAASKLPGNTDSRAHSVRSVVVQVS